MSEDWIVAGRVLVGVSGVGGVGSVVCGGEDGDVGAVGWRIRGVLVSPDFGSQGLVEH